MPIGTALHDRTSRLCRSLSYREWSGYFAVSSYDTHHAHEYSAIRHAAALIDVTPLFKYVVTGRDANRFVNRVVTRDVSRVAVGQMIYTPWCDGAGKTIDDGTLARLDERRYRWTSAHPSLAWLVENARGLDVTVDDVSSRLAALAVQGPTSGALLASVAEADIDTLRFYRVTPGRIGGVPVDISRTGYTGDLGYEIWVDWTSAVRVWDVLAAAGPQFGLQPAGMLALDVARIEAGFLLVDVDYISSRRALAPWQRYSPFEMGLDRLVSLDKGPFIGRAPLAEEARTGPPRRIVGLELAWPEVESLFDEAGLPPQVPAAASRVPVPVYRSGQHVGKATSTTWSPVLKKLIALATVDYRQSGAGTEVEVEVSVDATRRRVGARVVRTPFFNPRRKTAVPPGTP